MAGCQQEWSYTLNCEFNLEECRMADMKRREIVAAGGAIGMPLQAAKPWRRARAFQSDGAPDFI
jgi:hypothetical protein